MSKQRDAGHENEPFVRNVKFNASSEALFDAITTLEGLRRWWTPLVEGTPLGGDVRFEFEGLAGQHIIMHVDEARRGATVRWTCRIHSAIAEWRDTRVHWNLRATGPDSCELRLEHEGLVPTLECYDHCEVGWDHFLGSIRSYVERGVGTPYRAASGTCEAGTVKTGDDTLSVVRAYYHGWTTKQFAAAIRLLANDLEVEVPVNEYPTTESFADALSSFGSLVKGVKLLAEFAKDDEAVLLYDMDVDRIGAMRVAEHFTVDQGRITRIRQIHDTTAVRAAGFVRG